MTLADAGARGDGPHVADFATGPGAPIDSVATGRWAGWSIAGLRILMGLLWIQNVGWKRPPFTASGGLGRFVKLGVDHPVFGPYAWFSEHVVLKNLTGFGWAVMLLELSLGVFLTLGLATRLWAAIGTLQAGAIMLSVLHAPNEWGWSYWMLIGIHVLLCATAAGRVAGLDGVVRPIWRRRRTRVSGLLLRVS